VARAERVHSLAHGPVGVAFAEALGRHAVAFDR